AHKLKDSFDGSVFILAQDEFVRPESGIPKIKERTDWEHPASIDFERIKAEAKAQKRNYDLIIVEGLLAFYDPELAAMFDLTVLMNISRETFMERRKQESRWGKEPDWYLEHVWDSYLKFGQFEAEVVLEDWDGEVLETSPLGSYFRNLLSRDSSLHSE
ncbi:MAG: hypothetical protein RIF46_01770, partial [Cyclobacteriaceae bacterium]